MEHFDDFLAAARGQTEPQRLLLVFARTECPPDATPAEREALMAPLAGAGVMAAGLVSKGVLGDVLADSGGAIVGGALGAAGLCKALGLDLDAAWIAKKAAK